MSERKDNIDFGSIIAPLMRPMFVLQMARTKRWSSASRLRAVKAFRDACREAEEAAVRFIRHEQEASDAEV